MQRSKFIRFGLCYVNYDRFVVMLLIIEYSSDQMEIPGDFILFELTRYKLVTRHLTIWLATSQHDNRRVQRKCSSFYDLFAQYTYNIVTTVMIV